MNVLHITAHLGGGAGKAVSGMALQAQRQFRDVHRVLLLQEPEKDGCARACREGGVAVSLWAGDAGALAWADVIVVSWWDHPVMARFLRELPAVSAALVLWSHVNGCHYPCLPFRLADAFDGVMFTSPYSLENPAWTPEERLRIRERARTVYGTGAFDPGEFAPKEAYENRRDFVVGYVGTLNYGKLHPDFVSYCQAACEKVPGLRFVMAGDRDSRLERDVQAAGLAERFSFPGFVSDVPALMRSFDVFGYLLNPSHYGTTENVLLEAMACGVPIAALRQNVEQYIVPDTAGCLVENAREYGEAVARLYRDPARREALGRQGREHVLKRYHAKENAARFHDACCQALGAPRGERDFSFLGGTPWEWFLFCLDERNRDIMVRARELPGSAGPLLRGCSPILREERKSSLRHFAAVYPQDRSLQTLKRQMEQE